MRAKLLEAAIDDHRQVRLAMFIADIDGLFDAIVLQRLSHAWSELARLFLGRRIGQITLDHNGDRIHGHDQQNDDYRNSHRAHVPDHLAERELITWVRRRRRRTRSLQKKEKK